MVSWQYVHPDTQGASKPTRNGYVHPSMEFLIATAITCSDISEMVDRVRVNTTVSSSTKADIVEIYKIHYRDALGLECDWDAKADWRNGSYPPYFQEKANGTSHLSWCRLWHWQAQSSTRTKVSIDLSWCELQQQSCSCIINRGTVHPPFLYEKIWSNF